MVWIHDANLFDLKAEDAILVSAKTGYNIDKLLQAIIARIPPPNGKPEAPLKMLQKCCGCLGEERNGHKEIGHRDTIWFKQ